MIILQNILDHMFILFNNFNYKLRVVLWPINLFRVFYSNTFCNIFYIPFYNCRISWVVKKSLFSERFYLHLCIVLRYYDVELRNKQENVRNASDIQNMRNMLTHNPQRRSLRY